MSAPSKRFKFTVSRTAIVNEVYEIEADSWEEAEGILYDGGYGDPTHTEFVDWHGDWTEDDREENCPLTKMIKEYKVDA